MTSCKKNEKRRSDTTGNYSSVYPHTEIVLRDTLDKKVDVYGRCFLDNLYRESDSLLALAGMYQEIGEYDSMEIYLKKFYSTYAEYSRQFSYGVYLAYAFIRDNIYTDELESELGSERFAEHLRYRDSIIDSMVVSIEKTIGFPRGKK